MRTLVVFEDHGTAAFEVLTDLRATFDLRCGAHTLVERLTHRFAHDRLVLMPHPDRAALVAEQHPGVLVGWDAAASGATSKGAGDAKAAPGDHTFVFVNGRLVVRGNDAKALESHAEKARGSDGGGGEGGGGLVVGGALAVAVTDTSTAGKLAEALQALWKGASDPNVPLRALGAGARALDALGDAAPGGSVLLEHVWELVQHNATTLVDDFEHGPGAGVSVGAHLDPGVHLMNDRRIRIEEGVRLRPGVVLDAEEGPITLEAGVDVQPQVVVRGPAWIGPGCLLKAGAKIHEATSVGPVCKVGGEIEGSILQAYSNKQHEGFLGHAFLGEWVNLGADTNNSDLKNNYGHVRMWESGRFVDTGTMFMGLVAADHVKSAINTQFNTGTVVGLSSQLFGAGFPPKYVPPFSWGSPDETYDLARALETARTVMARRQREFTTACEAAFRRAFERARKARDKPRA